MLLFNAPGPAPRIVRMFIFEKGLNIPFKEIDIQKGENRHEDFLEINPSSQVPTLQLEEGNYLSEAPAICEYLEDTYPSPPLIGDNPQQKAITRMWLRRIELNIAENLYNAFRFSIGLDLYRDRIHCLPEAALGLAQIVQEKLAWLDEQMGRRIFICGDQFTLADIVLFCALDFGEGVNQSMNTGLLNINAWFARIMTRDSAHASRHPEGVEIGRRGV